MKKCKLLRVSLIEEIMGLDISEHGTTMPKLESRVSEGLTRALSIKMAKKQVSDMSDGGSPTHKSKRTYKLNEVENLSPGPTQN